MRRTVTSLLLLVLAAVGVPAQAQVDSLVLTRDSATFYPGGDVPIPLIVQAGYELMYQNLDTLQPHNVWSVGLRPDGTRLFRSPIVPPWKVVEGVDPVVVPGVELLPPGQYPFFCDIHPSMRGTLTVQ